MARPMIDRKKNIVQVMRFIFIDYKRLMTSIGSFLSSWLPRTLIDQRNSFNFLVNLGSGCVMLIRRFLDKNRTLRNVLNTTRASLERLFSATINWFRLSKAMSLTVVL